jgi:hypothetical protein
MARKAKKAKPRKTATSPAALAQLAELKDRVSELEALILQLSGSVDILMADKARAERPPAAPAQPADAPMNEPS